MANWSPVVQAAVQAALEAQRSGAPSGRNQNGKKRHGLTAPRAFLIGAGIFTAGRVVVASRGRDMLENLQDRLSDFEARHLDHSRDGEPEEDEYYEDEEEPTDQGEEDFDDEEDDEPAGDGEEDVEEDVEEEDVGDEPEAENDEDVEEDQPRQRSTRRTSKARSRA